MGGISVIREVEPEEQHLLDDVSDMGYPYIVKSKASTPPQTPPLFPLGTDEQEQR